MKTITFYQILAVVFIMFSLLFAGADSVYMDIFNKSKLIALVCLLIGVVSYIKGSRLQKVKVKSTRFYQGGALD